MAVSNTVTYTADDGGVTINEGGSYGPPEEIASSRLRNDPLVSAVAQEFRERLAASGTSISAATAANPPVITSGGHGLQNGSKIHIIGVLGMVELNNRYYTINNRTATTFELQEPAALGESSSDVDGTGFTAWTSGGTVTVAGISGTATVSLG
ncbi:hypothetical protein LCGC14_0653980 [marine sediment metagenome]|uniref:Ubiquitin-activating enzyme E1 FCCH domain-containing protein n=1 Tax=marine sediment metagenome TaxID=412755 RepID=A0A0F9U411_9ZZZZ